MSWNRAIKQGGTFLGALAQGWGAYSLDSPLNLLPEDSLKSWYFCAKTIRVPTMTSRLHCQGLSSRPLNCGKESVAVPASLLSPATTPCPPTFGSLERGGGKKKGNVKCEKKVAPCTGKDKSRLDMPASHLHSWRLPWAGRGWGGGPTVPESIASYSQAHSTGLNSKWLSGKACQSCGLSV